VLNTLAEDLIQSRTELQKSIEENNSKISKLEWENLQSVWHIEELEAQFKKEAEAHKAKMAMMKEKF
jgi:regulator of replication initiation timing